MNASFVVDASAGKLQGNPLPGGGVLFAGIPFALAPIGPRRLRPPEPSDPWTGIRDATHYPAAPAQRGTAVMGSGDGLSVPYECDEDCLYVNVWTPDLSGQLPVLVWIYGGAFDMGSASPPMTDGAALSRQTGAVVVAANYRVGALGYLHLAGIGGPEWAQCSNLGLQDQAAALGWVRDNIAAFGGDPANVTIAGESAGAFSIGALLATPGAAGTFDKAILSSGSTERIFDADTGTAIAADLLAALGLDSVDDLRRVSIGRILDAQRTVVDTDIGRRNLPGGRSWGVVLDGAVLPRHPREAVANGFAADIGLLIGANRDEMRMFQAMQGDAYRPTDQHALLSEMRGSGVASPERLLAAYQRRFPNADLAELRTQFLTDAVYRLPASRLAAAQVGAGGRAHTYLFAAEPLGPALGAFHGADLSMLFDALDSIGASNAQMLAVRDDLMKAWASFAATGDPGWPLYDAHARPNTRQFGGTINMITEPPDDAVTGLWAEPV